MNQHHKENTGIELDTLSFGLNRLKRKRPGFGLKRKRPAIIDQPSLPHTNLTKLRALPSGYCKILSKAKYLVLGGSLLWVLLAVTMVTITQKVNISIPFFGAENEPKSDTCVSVGPLISSIDSGDIIKITMNIDCTRKSYRKDIAELDTEIRNQIIWSLQNPEVKKFISEGDYCSLRQIIGDSIKNIVPQGTVKEIYLSELLRY